MTQAIVNGILTGGLYAAFGIGLSLIYGVTRVISAVHGALIILGAFITFSAWQLLGIDPFLVIPILLVIGFATGYGFQRAFINPVVRRHILMTITLTFALDLILLTVILVVWGGNLRSISVDYAGAGFDVLGARIPVVRLLVFVLSLALAVGLDQVVRRTETGRRIRAVSQNRQAAEVLGLDADHYYAVAHGLGASVAVAAGAFLPLIQPIQPFMAMPLLMISFATVVLAGFGSVLPVIAAGLILALAENLTGVVAGLQYQRLSIFVVYLIVAVAWPHGLFGKKFYGH